MCAALLAHQALRLPWRFGFGNDNPTEHEYHDHFAIFSPGGEMEV